MDKTLPCIFEYNNFRSFLRDYQEARCAIDPMFTKSFVCRMLGLPRTRSYFNDVLNGKEVTDTFVERFIKLIGFGKSEAQFFRALVRFNQAQNPDEREFYFDQLISLNRTPTRLIDPKAYNFYREWYHNTIRSLLDVVNFKDDYDILSKKIHPQLSSKKIRESIELLKELGLIQQNADGYYKPTDKSITTGPFVKDDLVKQYQIQCMELAEKALLQKGDMPQSFTTNTISISEEGYKRLEKRLARFMSEVRSLVHKDERPADRVYQMNVQLFPSSKKDAS
jgi:uncharacterized protein (TIGR02147 family)